MTSRVLHLALLLLSVAASSALGQESVRLKAAVRVPDITKLTLSDIADIAGPQAKDLESIAIPDNIGTSTADSRTISIQQIRSALALMKGVNLGRIALSGAIVEIVRDIPVTQVPATEQQPEPTIETTPGMRVRDVIPTRLALERNIPIDDIRVTFNDADRGVLDTSLENRSWSITPTGESDHLPVQVRIYSKDQLILAKTIRVGIEVKRNVAIPLRAIRKGELLDPSLIKFESRWLAPSIDAASKQTILGKAARNQIAINSIIENRDAQEPILVRKGERIVVDCMVEGLLVRSTMRATAQARVGDVIVVEPLNPPREKTGRGDLASSPPAHADAVVYARINSPGRGVVTTQPLNDPKLTSENHDASRSVSDNATEVTQ